MMQFIAVLFIDLAERSKRAEALQDFQRFAAVGKDFAVPGSCRKEHLPPGVEPDFRRAADEPAAPG